MRRATAAKVLGLALAAAVAAAGTGCAKRKEKSAEEHVLLSADALYRRAIESLARANLTKAKEDLERIRFDSPESLQTLEPLVKLRLADVTFYRGDDISLIDARSKYLDFVTLHGDHPLAPYAQFQAGVCSLKQVRHPSRDQTETHKALEEFQEVVRRWPGSEYARAAQGVIDEASTYLAEHEFLVGKFYFQRKAYTAAAQRFRRIVDDYPQYPDKQGLYLFLGRALMLSAKDDEGRAYLNRLVNDYPESDSAQEARKFLASYTPPDKTDRKS